MIEPLWVGVLGEPTKRHRFLDAGKWCHTICGLIINKAGAEITNYHQMNGLACLTCKRSKREGVTR